MTWNLIEKKNKIKRHENKEEISWENEKNMNKLYISTHIFNIIYSIIIYKLALKMQLI